MPNDSTLSECVWHMPLSLPGDGGAYAQWLHPEWMCMTYASFSARWWRCLCPMTPPWVNVYDICLFLCQVMGVPMPNDSTLSECVWHMPLSLPGDGGAYAQWLHPEWMCMTYVSCSARWCRCLCSMISPWVNVYDICLFLCQVMEVPMPNDSTLSECASVEGMDHTHSQTMDMTTAKGHISMGPGGLNHTQSQSMEMTMANGRISMGPAGLDKTQSQSSMEMTMPSGRISLGPGGLNLTQSQTMDMTVAKGRISLGPGSLDHSHSRAMEMTLAEGHSSKVQGDLNSTAMDMTLPVGLLQMGQ